MTFSSGMCELRRGDCLDLMQKVPDGSVDMVLCDLPYGTTACAWDAVLPFAMLWDAYRRICKHNAAIVLTASQPFTSALVMSNIRHFKYCWVWDKVYAANFANANRTPLKIHEDVCVFSFGTPVYRPQKTVGEKNHTRKQYGKTKATFMVGAHVQVASDVSGMKFPKSIQRFEKHSSQCGLHPTQKPVPLMEYMIRTYTDEGDLVLDNCMGSGTTAVACANTKRRFLGMEKDEGYFATASERIHGFVCRNVSCIPLQTELLT